MTIAGHNFTDTPHGPTCACGRRRADVLLARRANIGELGWAHQLTLTPTEYVEIEAERDRIWTCVAAVASGAGIGGMAAGAGAADPIQGDVPD